MLLVCVSFKTSLELQRRELGCLLVVSKAWVSKMAAEQDNRLRSLVLAEGGSGRAERITAGIGGF